MECRFCKGKCQKAGRQKSGTPKYYCTHCKKYQQKTYIYKACQLDLKIWIPRLLCNSVGIRGMARVLEVSVNTIVKNILLVGNAVQKPAIPCQQEVVEMDELWTYIGKKENPYWVSYALCSNTKKVMDFKVGKRNKITLKVIVYTLLLSGVQVIRTDKLRLYQGLIPKEKHVSNAYSINSIERNNLNLRTHLKRLSRRTICFSRNLLMLEACLRIYFWLG
ncbi:MAG: IS1 family transposase [Chitinophagaceae bacterium]